MNERVYNNPIERLRSQERAERLEVKKVVEHILSQSGLQSVIDIGTGSGLFAEEFFNQGLQVSGVDINPDMISSAKSYLPECEFSLAPAELLPFADNSFDIAFMGLFLHEADDAFKALKESRRVAKKGTYILEWNFRIEEFGPPLEHRLTTETVKDLAQRAGFKNVKITAMKNLVLYELS